MADSKSKREQGKSTDEQEQAQTVLQENPDLDPNAPGIDEVERNRRREELTRRQG